MRYYYNSALYCGWSRQTFLIDKYEKRESQAASAAVAALVQAHLEWEALRQQKDAHLLSLGHRTHPVSPLKRRLFYV